MPLAWQQPSVPLPTFTAAEQNTQQMPKNKNQHKNSRHSSRLPAVIPAMPALAVYSGGQCGAFEWTQTEAEIEMRATVDPGVTGRDLEIDFRALCFRVLVAQKLLGEGELEAPVTADECVWCSSPILQ